jgi:hypothetical protein
MPTSSSFDSSTTTRKKRNAILNGYYNANLSGTPQNAQTRPEQTSQVSGEVVRARQIGCCSTYQPAVTPSNERNPGGK